MPSAYEADALPKSFFACEPDFRGCFLAPDPGVEPGSACGHSPSASRRKRVVVSVVLPEGSALPTREVGDPHGSCPAVVRLRGLPLLPEGRGSEALPWKNSKRPSGEAVLVQGVGLEPTTFGLLNRRSTN